MEDRQPGNVLQSSTVWSDSRHSGSVNLMMQALNYGFTQSGSRYLYTGNEECILGDPVSDQTGCHHDICKQAKSTGLSWSVYETVLYYRHRISAAKSPRMKDALRKQRDIQIASDEQKEVEWLNQLTKKMDHLATTTRDALLEALTSVAVDEKLFLPIFKEDHRDENAIETVGQKLSEMRQTLLLEHQSQFLGLVRDRIATTNPPSHWRNPIRYLGYFAPLQINHLNAGLMIIHDALSLNACVPYDIEYTLRDLFRQLNALATYTCPGYRNLVGFTISDLMHEIHNAILDENKGNPISNLTANSAIRDFSIFGALRYCASLTTKASQKLLDVSIASAKCSNSLPLATYKKLTDAYIRISLLPTVTQRAMRYQMRRAQLYFIAHYLLEKAPKTAHKVLCDVVSNAVRDIGGVESEHYLDIVEEVGEIYFHDCVNQVGNENAARASDVQIQRILSQSILQARLSMFGAESNAKQRFATDRIKSTDGNIQKLIGNHSAVIQVLPGMDSSFNDIDPGFLAIYLSSAIEASICNDIDPSKRQLDFGWVDLTSQNMWRGITESFCVYRFLSQHSPIDLDYPTLSELLLQASQDVQQIQGGGMPVASFFEHYRGQNCCVCLAIVRFCMMLPTLCCLNPTLSKNWLKCFAALPSDGGSYFVIPPDWVKPFKILLPCLTEAYSFFALEAAHAFGCADVELIAFTLLWLMVYHALIGATMEVAKIRSADFLVFLSLTFKVDLHLAPTWLTRLSQNLQNIVEVKELRCSSPTKCMAIGADVSPTEKHVRHAQLRHQDKLTCRHKEQHARFYRTAIRTHYSKLRRFLHAGIENKIEAACLLRYIALCTKFPSIAVDKNMVTFLWRVFLHAEVILDLTPKTPDQTQPSALTFGMRNQCNIWELCVVPEKARAFFTGLKLGFRAGEDIDSLLESVKLYALEYGDPRGVMRRYGALTDITGPELIQAHQLAFQNAQKDVAARINSNTTLRQFVARKKFARIVSLKSPFEQPTFEFFTDLRRRNEDRLAQCLLCLRQIVGDDTLHSALAEMIEAVNLCLDLAGTGKSSSINDQTLQKISKGALSIWSTIDPEDVIRSDCFSENSDDTSTSEESSDTSDSSQSEDSSVNNEQKSDNSEFMMRKSDFQKVMHTFTMPAVNICKGLADDQSKVKSSTSIDSEHNISLRQRGKHNAIYHPNGFMNDASKALDANNDSDNTRDVFTSHSEVGMIDFDLAEAKLNAVTRRFKELTKTLVTINSLAVPLSDTTYRHAINVLTDLGIDVPGIDRKLAEHTENYERFREQVIAARESSAVGGCSAKAGQSK